RLALQATGEKRFSIWDGELHRSGPSYTVDTLRALGAPDEDLALLVGNEVFSQFPRWKNPGEILDLCTVIVFSREPGAKNPIPAVTEKLSRSDDGILWCPLSTL